MKKYSLTLISLAISLVLALLLFVQPKLQKDQLALETISGDPTFIENRVLGLSYHEGQDFSYERRATFFQGNTSWDEGNRGLFTGKTLINQAFPIGQRPFRYGESGDFLALRPQLYFFSPFYYERTVEKLQYQLIDMEKKAFEKYEYRFQNQGVDHAFSSFAVNGDQAYLLFRIFHLESGNELGFVRLTLDIKTGQITQEDILDLDLPEYPDFEEMDGDTIEYMLPVEASYSVSPNYWVFIRDVTDNKSQENIQSDLVLIDPISLEEKTILTKEDMEDLYDHYLYQDQVYYYKGRYDDDGILVQSDLVHYQVETGEEETLYSSKSLDDSLMALALIDDQFVVIDKLEDDARIIGYDAKTGQENYQGIVLNSNPELVFLNALQIGAF